MMHIVLAESEIELVPDKIKNHPAIKSENEILDASLHHSAMKNIEDAYRRGRPDIIHFFLNNVMESVLNKKGMLSTYIHTRNDELIHIKPETRIIKNYNRFKGLFSKLLMEKAVPENTPLMWVENKSMEEFLSEMPHKKIFFSRRGKRIRIHELGDIMNEDVVIVIGGFPYGYFSESYVSMADEIVSIGDEALTAWIVAMEAIVAYENVLKF